MAEEILYQDGLIEIRKDVLILKNYYYPSKSSKSIKINDIEKTEMKKPTIISGKWRIQGTGDFRTWYPLDISRPKRDKIFIIIYKNKWIRSGFTVENSKRVEEIFRKQHLIS